jgi:hypothetical protein
MTEMENAYIILVGKPENKTQGVDWRIILKRTFKERCMRMLSGFTWFRRVKLRALVNM